jgi:superfamily II DNA/RNA helicase
MKFSELGLPEAFDAGLAKEDIIEPTDIQQVAIPQLLERKPAYVSAETGTGKTLAYLLPLIANLDLEKPAAQAIIIAPTHELALQIQRTANAFAQNSFLPLRALLLLGGTSMKRQLEKLKKKPQLIIGSPGRILDLIEMRKLKVNAVTTVVTDEADRLLYSDGLKQVKKIIECTPKGRQLVFVSATEQKMSSDVAYEMEPNLVRLHTHKTNKVNQNIEHFYVKCEERDKAEMLRKFIRAINPERSLVFLHRNESAETIASKLSHHKINVADLHGSFDKMERKKAMEAIRSGKAQVLISSDVAARGLDIKGVTHVFNVDFPSQSKAYLHRVGRTARAGATGHAISFITFKDVNNLQRTEKELGIKMTELTVQNGEVVKIIKE